MPSRKREQELLDRLWDRVRPLLPVRPVNPTGGRPETALGPAALASIPAAVPVAAGTPVMADRAYDSDRLREQLAADGLRLVARHRKGRKRPPTADGRRCRWLKRRWVVERTFAW